MVYMLFSLQQQAYMSQIASPDDRLPNYDMNRSKRLAHSYNKLSLLNYLFLLCASYIIKHIINIRHTHAITLRYNMKVTIC